MFRRRPGTTVKPDGKIENLQDAINILDKIQRDRRFLRTSRRQGFQDRFPVGIWFRGQACNWELRPKVFRPRLDGAPSQLYDEANIFAHCQVRLPDYHNRCRTKFDWLCLMQHYEVPSRLLDWSESLLIALYFAVSEGDKGESAQLIVLNARRLNSCAYRTRILDAYGLCIPSSIDVVVRAEMAAQRSRSSLIATLFGGELESPEVRLWAKMESSKLPPELEKKGERLLANLELCNPIAVVPNRINERMIFQSSAFTLHGGKMYHTSDRTKVNDRLELPASLEEINRSEKNGRILKYYEIPRKRIVPIREQLFKLGIHKGSLFPEIDQQGSYLCQLW